jgi:hypothetical protein
MSKIRIAPKATAEKKRETIPLADVQITVGIPRLFTNGDSDKKVTFDGERLGAALRWVALTCPNLDYFTDEQSVSLELTGIGETCRALIDVDFDMASVDCNAVFAALSRRLLDLAHRINAKEPGCTEKTLTITRGKAVA